MADEHTCPEHGEPWGECCGTGSAPTAEPTTRSRRLIAISADTMAMRSPEWLEELRIPAGAITLLGGREGIGKSTIAFDRAARITRGTLPGRYEGTPRSVGVVAGEDSWESVILPRLVAAGADRSRVFRIEAQDEDDREDAVSLPADVHRLTEVCRRHDIVLVVVDPIISVIHGSLDTHKDRDVRQALDPLSRFARETGVAVLGLIHVNKSTTDDPLNSLMSSRAFAAVARSVLYCIADPKAEEESYLFGHPKSNLGPKQPTLTYRVDEVKIELPEGGVITSSRIVWTGEDDRSIGEAMAERTEREPVVGEVAMRIAVWVAQQGRPVATAEIAAELPEVKPATVRQNLKRMVERGQLRQPVYGHYVTAGSDTAPGARNSVTPVTSRHTAGEVTAGDGCDGVTETSEPVTAPVTHPVASAALRSTPSMRGNEGNTHSDLEDAPLWDET